MQRFVSKWAFKGTFWPLLPWQRDFELSSMTFFSCIYVYYHCANFHTYAPLGKICPIDPGYAPLSRKNPLFRRHLKFGRHIKFIKTNKKASWTYTLNHTGSWPFTTQCVIFITLKGLFFLQRKEVATSNSRIVLSLAWALCVPNLSLLRSFFPFFLNFVIILTSICLKK